MAKKGYTPEQIINKLTQEQRNNSDIPLKNNGITG